MKTAIANLVFPLLIIGIGVVFFICGIAGSTPLEIGLLEFGSVVMLVGFVFSFVVAVEEVAFYRRSRTRLSA